MASRLRPRVDGGWTERRTMTDIQVIVKRRINLAIKLRKLLAEYQDICDGKTLELLGAATGAAMQSAESNNLFDWNEQSLFPDEIEYIAHKATITQSGPNLDIPVITMEHIKRVQQVSSIIDDNGDIVERISDI